MIKNITTAQHYRWGGECDGWRLLDRTDLSVIQERIPQGAGELKHYHERSRQLFYVLSGRMEITISGGVHRLAQGDSLEVPPGCVHEVRNHGECEVVFLVVSAPSTIGDRINVET